MSFKAEYHIILTWIGELSLLPFEIIDQEMHQ
jgi:hypothetical protein